MNNENDTLHEAKKLVHYISIQDRLNQLQILLQGVAMQNIKIASLDIQIKNNALLEVYSDELYEIQENQLETLRTLKNSVVFQTLAMHKQAQSEL